MSQFNEALLANQAANLGAAQFADVANIQAGAQLGIGPRILQIDAATPLVFNPAIIVLLTAPTMWDRYPAAKNALKSLFEMHAKSVSGLSFGYTLNFADTPNGHDGQQLSMPTNSQRTAVSPSFTWPEIYGNVVWNLHLTSGSLRSNIPILRCLTCLPTSRIATCLLGCSRPFRLPSSPFSLTDWLFRTVSSMQLFTLLSFLRKLVTWASSAKSTALNLLSVVSPKVLKR